MRRKFKIFVRTGSLIVIMAANLLFFMNCSSDIEFGSRNPGSIGPTLAAGGGGNADGYDGKPDPGTYYRNIPDYKCKDKLVQYGKMTVTKSEANLSLIDPRTCEAITTTVSLDRLDRSRWNRQTIGYVEGIYEKRDQAPRVDDRNDMIVESWCRMDDQSSSGLDILVRTDAANQKSISTLFVGSVQEVPAFSVGRSLKQTSLTYQGTDFKLNVDLRNLPSGAVDVPGVISVRIGSLLYSGAVRCRTGAHLDQKQTSPLFTCPQGFISVPSLAGFSSSDFCVAKYEAKAGTSGAATSVAAGLPWNDIPVTDAIAACQANGTNYDLISNSQWQAVARNIESVGGNWSGGSVGSGDLNKGFSNSLVALRPLAASANDDDACLGTSEVCSGSVWNLQRRTHVLTSGAVIWDLGGNVTEWVKDPNLLRYGPDAHISELTNSAPFLLNTKDMFGPAGNYSDRTAEPFAGLGKAMLNLVGGATARGGRATSLTEAGIFFVDNNLNGVNTPNVGFRCVYQP